MYLPSSGSLEGKDSEEMDDSITDGIYSVNNSVLSWETYFAEPDEFSGTMVLVMWTSLLQLLCKCRREGCGAAVLPDNMKPIKKGNIMLSLHVGSQ